MENYNIQIVFEESEEETQRLLALITEEEPDMKDMLSRVSIVPECHSQAPSLYFNKTTLLTADIGLKRLYKTLTRDFLVSMPRIATLRTISNTDASSEGVRFFGPYTQEMLFDQQRQFEAFDLVITESDQQAQSLLEETCDSPLTGIVQEENQLILEASVYSNNDGQNCQSLRQAVYMALDIADNRRVYDQAHSHPLPKLFHDTPDRGERQHFAPFAPKSPVSDTKTQHLTPNANNG